MNPLIQLIRRAFGRANLMEVASAELDAAERSKLEAESAREYATSMVTYHEARIRRLRKTIAELSKEAS